MVPKHSLETLRPVFLPSCCDVSIQLLPLLGAALVVSYGCLVGLACLKVLGAVKFKVSLFVVLFRMMSRVARMLGQKTSCSLDNI